MFKRPLRKKLNMLYPRKKIEKACRTVRKKKIERKPQIMLEYNIESYLSHLNNNTKYSNEEIINKFQEVLNIIV
jgi:hypothetical protein